MKTFLRAAALVFLTGIFAVQPTQAQLLEEGEWYAMMLTPGGELAEALYEVDRIGNEHRATIKWLSGEAPITDLSLEGDLLSYSWNPGFHMACRLERQSNRQYKGGCMDEFGNVGPTVLSPPGTVPETKDFDVNKALELWDISREEYFSERNPERPVKSAALTFPEPDLLPGRKVEVRGGHMNLVDQGEGDVTVILESGIGDDHQIWHQVQQSVAELTRVVSYDRVGLGLSDPRPISRSPEATAAELRNMLEAAGIEPPYILVGHEAGGFTVRSFAALYPNDVAGLVLVDPAHEKQAATWKELDASGWEEYLRKKHSMYANISEPVEAEFEAFTRVLEEGDLSVPDALPDVPVVVLSAVRPSENPAWVGETLEGLQAKKALHESLADQANGTLIATSESSTYIHLEEPELVLTAVKQVLESVE